MAQRRMFSLKIVGSDAFLEMPTSARELYFQLGMYADDDGFVNPRKIMRMVGSSEDDIRFLIGKRFVLPFDNGVVVIKHWLINNLVRKDFYQETMYVDQKNTLQIKDNKAYTENVNNLLPQVRLGKDRLLTANAEIEIRDATPEDEPKTKDSDPLLRKSAQYWHALCKKNVGQEPSGGLTKTMGVIKRAKGTLSYSQIKEMMNDWFEGESLDDHDMIQVTRCLSSYQIDKYLASNV